MTPDRRRAVPAGSLGTPTTGGPTAPPASVEEAVADAVAARRPGEVTGVLAVELDRADVLGDAYGWALVDDLVAELGERLGRTVRSDDRLLPAGRGGLCLVARSMPGQRDVALLAERVVRVGGRPLALPDGVEHEVTVSVGAAVGRAGDPPPSLVARAQRRCRQVAEAGGGRWSVEPVGSYAGSASAAEPGRAVRDGAVARLRQAGELRQALATGELDLALAPLTPLAAEPALAGSSPGDRRPRATAGAQRVLPPGTSVGADRGEWRTVTVRWRHPVRGLLHPGAVVAAVTDAGLAGAYLETVFRAAGSAALDASVAAGLPVGVAVDLPLAVAAQARAQGTDLTALVVAAVTRARLDPAQLALRITVDDARSGGELLAPVLEHLAALGVSAMLVGVDPSPGELAWLGAWRPASVWLLDRAVAGALAAPTTVPPGSLRHPVAPELAPGVVLARAATAAAVAAAGARGIVVGAEGVDDPAVAAELAAAGVCLAHGRWRRNT
ncbi:MAG: diguanylate cyclase [Acidimicrobiales bacterium]